ncbi:MAG: CheW domain-containing protein [Kofleriaceae bacterium]
MLRNVVLFQACAARPGAPEDAPEAAHVEGPPLLAADLRAIREIATLGFVTFVPTAPTPISGVVQLRGALVPVVDLAAVLGASSEPPQQGAPALIVEREQTLAAFRIHALVNVASLPATELPSAVARALPAGLAREAVVADGGALVPLLEFASLLRHCAQLVATAARATDAVQGAT